jgi:hypothetical protein
VSEPYVKVVISLIKNDLFTRSWAITDSAIQYHLPDDNWVDCGVPNVKGQASQEAGARDGRCGEFFRSYDATRYGEMIRDCMTERKSPMCVMVLLGCKIEWL